MHQCGTYEFWYWNSTIDLGRSWKLHCFNHTLVISFRQPGLPDSDRNIVNRNFPNHHECPRSIVAHCNMAIKESWTEVEHQGSAGILPQNGSSGMFPPRIYTLLEATVFTKTWGAGQDSPQKYETVRSWVWTMKMLTQSLRSLCKTWSHCYHTFM